MINERVQGCIADTLTSKTLDLLSLPEVPKKVRGAKVVETQPTICLKHDCKW